MERGGGLVYSLKVIYFDGYLSSTCRVLWVIEGGIDPGSSSYKNWSVVGKAEYAPATREMRIEN